MTIQEMRDVKERTGLSNKALAALAGVPLGTVQKVLSGETKAPRHNTVMAISEALERALDDIEQYRKQLSTDPDLSGTMHLREDSTAFRYKGGGSDIPDVIEDAWTRSWRRQGTYTVKDYEMIPDGVRVELIDGVIYDMDAPTLTHQLIAGYIYKEMFNFGERSGKKNCMPVIAPYDVQLNKDDRTMVQPDVLVICNRDGRDISKRLYGAPDFVLEVLSPATKAKDLIIKSGKYAAAGVRECWLVDPESQEVLVYDFENLRFPETYTFNDTVPVIISGGELTIDFKSIREYLENILQ